MASYAVAATEMGAYAKTLVASTVDTVTFGRPHETIEMWTDGSAAVYFTVDGSTPTVAGQNGYEVPIATAAGAIRDNVPVPTTGNTVVKVISAGTPKYSVTGSGGIFT